MKSSTCRLLLWVSLLIGACTAEPAENQAEQPKAAAPSAVEAAPLPGLSAAAYNGWIAVGGTLTLGMGHEVGKDFVSLLARQHSISIRNAAVYKEGLSGLLQRLPRLTEQHPAGFIIELEGRGVPLSAFERDLRRLQPLLKGYPLIVIGAAASDAHQRAAAQFAAHMGAPFVEARAPAPSAAQLAARILPLLSEKAR